MPPGGWRRAGAARRAAERRRRASSLPRDRRAWRPRRSQDRTRRCASRSAPRHGRAARRLRRRRSARRRERRSEPRRASVPRRFRPRRGARGCARARSPRARWRRGYAAHRSRLSLWHILPPGAPATAGCVKNAWCSRRARTMSFLPGHEGTLPERDIAAARAFFCPMVTRVKNVRPDPRVARAVRRSASGGVSGLFVATLGCLAIAPTVACGGSTNGLIGVPGDGSTDVASNLDAPGVNDASSTADGASPGDAGQHGDATADGGAAGIDAAPVGADANVVDMVDAGAGCGNGMLDPGEQCDDGNRFNLDGCDYACRYEAVNRMTLLSIQGTAAPAFCTPATNRLGTQSFTSTALGQLNPSLQTDINSGSTNLFA